jgi:hypothetical protein
MQHWWHHYVIQPRSEPDFQISAFPFKYTANVNSEPNEIVKIYFVANQRKNLRTPAPERFRHRHHGDIRHVAYLSTSVQNELP